MDLQAGDGIGFAAAGPRGYLREGSGQLQSKLLHGEAFAGVMAHQYQAHVAGSTFQRGVKVGLAGQKRIATCRTGRVQERASAAAGDGDRADGSIKSTGDVDLAEIERGLETFNKKLQRHLRGQLANSSGTQRRLIG